MVALLLYTADVIDTDLGVRKETVAYTGGIQLYLDLDFMHGAGTAFDINIYMPKYLMPMARCLETQQTVKSNDLSQRYRVTERRFAMFEAQRLAENVSASTGRTWQAYVDEYTVDADNRVRV